MNRTTTSSLSKLQSSKKTQRPAMAVRVINEIHVSPSPSLPSQPPQPLTFLDSIWFHGSPVERLFFYGFPHPTSHFIDHHLPNFTKSLSLTLYSFYPLAGTVRRSAVPENYFEIAYSEGDYVTVTVAEFTGDDFCNISGHHPRDFNKLQVLVPKSAKSLDGQHPPISVQVTLFPNQGICIGFSVHHAVCDGSSSMHFIRSWAAAFRLPEDRLDITAPLLDRSVIVDACGQKRRFLKSALEYVEKSAEHLPTPSTVPSPPSNMLAATFVLGKDKIRWIKERVKARAAEKGAPPFHCSTFAVSCAFVWRCLIQAREYESDFVHYFGFAVDWRSRMRPAIPSNYFGNCLGSCLTELKAGEVVGEDGVEVAAMAIGKSIGRLQDEYVGEGIEALADRYAELMKSRPVSIAGSPKLRVYETDFGWGRPVKVEVTSIVESGAISMAESREDEGGVEIGMVLPEEEIAAFKAQFASGLLDL